MKPLFSVIIPVRSETKYLAETRLQLKNQSFASYELIVVTDALSKNSNPGFKRNFGAKMAQGRYLAFLDDDSYPSPNWLKSAHTIFSQKPKIQALCGPCLTPPADNPYQQASGLIWSSWLGSGGAGTFRNQPSPVRFVDDYPTVNLIVKKKAFTAIHGFRSHTWPGEDTVFCLDLINKFGPTILYHPQLLVYHHRREIIFPHLKQLGRYAVHRGYFVKKFPQTSFRLGYFIPSLFVFYLLSLPFHHFYWPLLIYLLLLLFTYFKFIINKNSFLVASLAALSIPLTHLYYGILFLFGLFMSDLSFKPHRFNHDKKVYIGG